MAKPSLVNPLSKTEKGIYPESAIKSLTDEEYRATTREKKQPCVKGKQVSRQPKKIAKKTASHRKF